MEGDDCSSNGSRRAGRACGLHVWVPAAGPPPACVSPRLPLCRGNGRSPRQTPPPSGRGPSEAVPGAQLAGRLQGQGQGPRCSLRPCTRELTIAPRSALLRRVCQAHRGRYHGGAAGDLRRSDVGCCSPQTARPEERGHGPPDRRWGSHFQPELFGVRHRVQGHGSEEPRELGREHSDGSARS